jgi:hypothetical protein
VQLSLIKNRNTEYTRQINAEANLITAMLCKVDGAKPGVFCNRSSITRIESGLR